MKSYALSQAKRMGNVFTLDQLCELVEVTPYDDPEGRYKGDTLYDWNWEHIEERAEQCAVFALGWDWYHGTIYKPCLECDETGEVYDEALGEVGYECLACGGSGKIEVEWEDFHELPEYDKAYGEAETELYNGWKNAVETVFERVFEPVGLGVIEVVLRGDGRNTPLEQAGYELKPTKSWWDVCAELVDTINGVGYFWFNSVKNLMESIPTLSPKKAALDHLHWSLERHKVYDSYSPARIYDDAIEHYLRYW